MKIRLVNVRNEHIKAVYCQLKYVPKACEARTPVVNDRETHVRKAPLFFGSVISPIIIDPNGPSIPMAIPCRNLAVIRPATSLTKCSMIQPIILGMMVRRWHFFRPIVSIKGVIMMLPMMSAKPITDAGIWKIYRLVMI